MCVRASVRSPGVSDDRLRSRTTCSDRERKSEGQERRDCDRGLGQWQQRWNKMRAIIRETRTKAKAMAEAKAREQSTDVDRYTIRRRRECTNVLGAMRGELRVRSSKYGDIGKDKENKIAASYEIVRTISRGHATVRRRGARRGTVSSERSALSKDKGGGTGNDPLCRRLWETASGSAGTDKARHIERDSGGPMIRNRGADNAHADNGRLRRYSDGVGALELHSAERGCLATGLCESDENPLSRDRRGKCCAGGRVVTGRVVGRVVRVAWESAERSDRGVESPRSRDRGLGRKCEKTRQIPARRGSRLVTAFHLADNDWPLSSVGVDNVYVTDNILRLQENFDTSQVTAVLRLASILPNLKTLIMLSSANSTPPDDVATIQFASLEHLIVVGATALPYPLAVANMHFVRFWPDIPTAGLESCPKIQVPNPFFITELSIELDPVLDSRSTWHWRFRFIATCDTYPWQKDSLPLIRMKIKYDVFVDATESLNFPTVAQLLNTFLAEDIRPVQILALSDNLVYSRDLHMLLPNVQQLKGGKVETMSAGRSTQFRVDAQYTRPRIRITHASYISQDQWLCIRRSKPKSTDEAVIECQVAWYSLVGNLSDCVYGNSMRQATTIPERIAGKVLGTVL
ncbi:hypothetical protein FA95DRAFT_1577794 [Auriscalpium vulgare]|uniref:Uncharacterized protein n=1 Tax=Auriscalpium vulgare TaxID=40419 RepID=A0ACB8R4X5_9AGAM|nr:hypothetical protein FA95DRAFT_1577794 [Auriscalpium vulgare]